jgi:3-hydroxyacyl-CoA dehydrogenase / enoyl-CoA hydratase / 3-hydroxybutyryl-CoA epimerase
MGGDIAAWCACAGSTSRCRIAPRVRRPALERAAEFFASGLRAPAEAAANAARLRADVAGAACPQRGRRHRGDLREPSRPSRRCTRARAAMKPDACSRPTPRASCSRTLAAPAGSRPARRPAFLQPGRADAAGRSHPRRATPATETLQAALAFARRIDKLPLPCMSAPGFVVNRVLCPTCIEAMLARERGRAARRRSTRRRSTSACPWARSNSPTRSGSTSPARRRMLAAAFGGTRPCRRRRTTWRPAEARPQDRRGVLSLARRQGKPARRRCRPADLEDRLVLPLAQRGRCLPARGIVEDADLLDAGVDLRHRVRAVPRRAAALRPRARRPRSSRGSRSWPATTARASGRIRAGRRVRVTRPAAAGPVIDSRAMGPGHASGSRRSCAFR